jgi:hypothetical protein
MDFLYIIVVIAILAVLIVLMVGLGDLLQAEISIVSMPIN